MKKKANRDNLRDNHKEETSPVCDYFDPSGASLEGIVLFLQKCGTASDVVLQLTETSMPLFESLERESDDAFGCWSKKVKAWRAKNGDITELPANLNKNRPPNQLGIRGQLKDRAIGLRADLTVVRNEVRRIARLLADCGHDPKALEQNAKALRVLCDRGISIKWRCEEIVEDYGHDPAWASHISPIIQGAFCIVGSLQMIDAVACRLDVLYVPAQDIIGAPSGQSNQAEIRQHYIFKDNFCSIWKVGQAAPFMNKIRMCPTTAVLRRLFECPNKEPLKWSVLQRECGFSKDSPGDFFYGHKNILQLLDIQRVITQAGIDWTVCPNPSLDFSAK